MPIGNQQSLAPVIYVSEVDSWTASRGFECDEMTIRRDRRILVHSRVGGDALRYTVRQSLNPNIHIPCFSAIRNIRDGLAVAGKLRAFGEAHRRRKQLQS